MSLLGFLAAGAAGGYATAKNAQTEQRNKLEMMLIQQDMQEMYQQRRDERMMKREDAVYQRSRGDKLEDEKRERGYKQEDFDRVSAHDLKKLEVQHGYNKSLEGIRQAGMEKRLNLKASNGLLNTGSKGDFSRKEIAKANESDQKRIFDLKKEMQSPMVFNNVEQRRLLEEEIKRLEFNIRDREALMKYGDSPLNLGALGQ